MSRNEVQRQSERNASTDDELQSKPTPKRLRITIVLVCIINVAAIAYIAVLIGMQKGWKYSIHCFVLCMFALLLLIPVIRSKTKLQTKNACSRSYIMLVIALSTSFTLLTRQAYYHGSSGQFESKWVLFSLQISIIPLIVGMFVMFECSLQEIFKNRFIIMIAVLDFADIWDMASMLSPEKAPFIKEESPIEIAIQFFCSYSLSNVSFFLNKVIVEEYLNIFMRQSNVSQQDQGQFHRAKGNFCTAYAKLSSHMIQNIPFLVIRILVLLQYFFVDFDFLAKNVISAILFLASVCKGCCSCVIPSS